MLHFFVLYRSCLKNFFCKGEWLVSGLKILFLLGIIFAGVEDKKIRKIPNKLSFLLLTLSFLTLCLTFVCKGHIDKLRMVLGLGVGFCFLVKTKIIGGGDFKILLATSLIFPLLTYYSLIISMSVGILKVRKQAYPPLTFYFSISFTIFVLFCYLCTNFLRIEKPLFWSEYPFVYRRSWNFKAFLRGNRAFCTFSAYQYFKKVFKIPYMQLKKKKKASDCSEKKPLTEIISLLHQEAPSLLYEF